MWRFVSYAASLAVLFIAIGCGSASVDQLPPVAQPAESPPLVSAAAGRLVDAGDRADAVVVSTDRRRAVVAVRDPALLLFLDARTGRIARRVPLAEPVSRLELVEGGEVVLAASTEDDTVRRFRVRDGRRLSPIRRPFGGLGAVRRAGTVAVVSPRERVLELYDQRTGRLEARVPAGVGPTAVTAEPRGNHLYVVDTAGNGLLVFDTKPKLELVRRVHLPGRPYGIAVDRRSRRIWVTLTGRNELVALPAHGRPHITATFPTVRQPNSVAVDEKSGRVFVAGSHDGVVQVLDP